MIKKKRIIVCGLGRVGKEFVKLVADKADFVRDKYNLELRIVAITELAGAATTKNGEALPISELIDHLETGGNVETFGRYGRVGLNTEKVIETVQADLIVEATPTNIIDGEPAKTHMLTALRNKMDVIAANKGPLVLFNKELHNFAKLHKRSIYMSAATAAALPSLDVGLFATAGAKVTSFVGILNGTTNYILTRMHKDQCPYDEALKEAQKLGIAESDPTLDVEGFDTANKTVLIANKIFKGSFSLSDVDRKGITHLSSKDILDTVKSNRVIKLIGIGKEENGKWALAVEPKALDEDHPLSNINYSKKGISFNTDTMGIITVSGGKSSPIGAAAALLKDIIHSTMFCF